MRCIVCHFQMWNGIRCDFTIYLYYLLFPLFQPGAFSTTGFGGPDADNEEGCSLCLCDPGGSTSPTCAPIGGQCSCRPNIAGRRCNEPVDTTFGAVLSQMTYDAEFADNANVRLFVCK